MKTIDKSKSDSNHKATKATSELATLSRALNTQLDLSQAASLPDLIAAAEPCWLQPEPGRRLRFGGHLDVMPHLLVYAPPPHGVLGLVCLLPAAAGDFVAAARHAVEEAVQLRQLLLEAAEASDPPQRALQVELVLLVPSATGDDAQRRLADEFNHIARHTHYVRLIGLNLLPMPTRGDIDRAALRRAFCWLLHDTRAWFKEQLPEPGPPAPPHRWQLRLHDYRMAGERSFGVGDGRGRLHLVHGHNGAGKSSLVEALELLLTHKVQRLDHGGQSPYFGAIRHRPRNEPPPSAAARAELELDGEFFARCVIDAAGQTFARGAPSVQRAQSFRIDQAFMNDLVRADGAGRAILFLEAFAPNDNQLLADVREKQDVFEQAWAKLPAALLPATTPDDMALRLRWAQEQLAALTVTRTGAPVLGWLALLPMTAAELALLAPVRRGLAEQLEALAAAPASAAPSLLSHIDGELAALRDALPAMAADLRLALRVMHEFAPWEAAGQVHRGSSFEHDLQRWLELMALVDLSRKYGDVVQTLSRAAEQGWAPDVADAKALPALPPDGDGVARVRQRGAELQQELNDARERLRAWQGNDAPRQRARKSAKAGTPPSRRYLLSLAEQQGLDRAGAWLPAAAAPLPLGQWFAQALARNQAVTLADGVIGAPGGLQRPIEQAQALIATIDAVLERPKSAWHSSSAALRRAEAAVKAAAALHEARSRLSGSFFQKLVEADAGSPQDTRHTQHLLQDAVNELLALATPARWAYSDIGLRTVVQGGRAELGLAAQGTRADLLLNTAELSAFTLVLFLLLAPRVDNPLRVLVLDDPLQNMDEMMVCTLARALASLLSVFPKGWSVLAFFHGMDDMERIREEAPAEVYHLPWARPLSGGGDAKAGKKPAFRGERAVIEALPKHGTAGRADQALDGQLLSLARS